MIQAVLSALGFLLLFANRAVTAPSNSSGPELWFITGDDLSVNGNVAHADFMRLFDAPDQWKTGLARVNVMMLRAPWFLRATPEVDKRVVDFLKQHDIGLAVPLGFVSSDTCGQGVEGLGDQRQKNVYPRDMKKRGIELDYVVMDEPLYYARDYGGMNACHFSIPQIIASVTENVKMIRSYYPNVKFVWVEPPQSLVDGPREMVEFLDAYKASLGEYPSSVRFDIAWGHVDKWTREWHMDLPGYVQALKAHGIGYGIIYDAGRVNGRVPNTDADWVASAKANVADWERTIREKPSQVIIQSWSPNPVRIVPEDDPTTMTGYLKWYVATHR